MRSNTVQGKGQGGPSLSKLTGSSCYIKPQGACYKVLWCWWLMLPSTRAPPLLPVNWSLQHSLTLVKKLYHSCTVHTPLMSWGKFFSITVSYAGTESHFRAHIAWWCAESNQPLGIVKDWQFKILMKTGCPRTLIPSPLTVARDVKLVFERAREWLDKILRVHFLYPVAHCCWYYDF